LSRKGLSPKIRLTRPNPFRQERNFSLAFRISPFRRDFQISERKDKKVQAIYQKTKLSGKDTLDFCAQKVYNRKEGFSSAPEKGAGSKGGFQNE